MRVLLVEDDAGIAGFVKSGLEENGFSVDWAREGESGLDLGLSRPYDCAVVDLMLPGLDGSSVIAQWRQEWVAVPILILSARRSVADRVAGLRGGSDDYLTKPFAFAELLARIQALIRRRAGAAEPARLTVGPLALDLGSREVTRDGRRLDLQPREFALLEFLMRNAGRVVSKTMILEHVWEMTFEPQANVVEARISRLRDKLDRPFEAKMIRTLRGVGYVLEDPSA